MFPLIFCYTQHDAGTRKKTKDYLIITVDIQSYFADYDFALLILLLK